MRLKIEKRQDYIWKCYCFGSHYNMDHAVSWYVVDADTGEVMDGGCQSGNNTHSGHVYNERKKDAKAWLDGFLAYQNDTTILREERVKRTREDGHEYYNNMYFVSGNPYPKSYHDKEDILRTQFIDGVKKAAKYFDLEVPVTYVKSFTWSDESEL